MKQPIECVGVVCLRADDVLLIKRAKPPRTGEWSIPGGRVEPVETHEQAILRELFEETQIKASVIGKIELVQAKFNGVDYNLHDYLAIWESGEPIAGDDAAHAEFVPISNIENLGMWSETVRIIQKARRILSEK